MREHGGGGGTEKVVEAGQVVWSPSPKRIESSRMLAFGKLAGERAGRDLRRCDGRDLYHILSVS